MAWVKSETARIQLFKSKLWLRVLCYDGHLLTYVWKNKMKYRKVRDWLTLTYTTQL